MLEFCGGSKFTVVKISRAFEGRTAFLDICRYIVSLIVMIFEESFLTLIKDLNLKTEI